LRFTVGYYFEREFPWRCEIVGLISDALFDLLGPTLGLQPTTWQPLRECINRIFSLV